MGSSFRRPHLVVALAAMAGGAIPFLPSLTACGDKYGENGVASNDDAGGGAEASVRGDSSDIAADSESDQDGSTGNEACTVSRAPSCGSNCVTTPLAPAVVGDSFPFGITSDANFVYWLTQPPPTATADGISQAYNGLADATILRVAKSGKEKPVTLLTGQPGAKHITLEGDYLYWVVRKGPEVQLRRMRRDCAPQTTCTAEAVATAANANSGSAGLARTAPESFAVLLDNGFFLRTTLTTRAFDTSIQRLDNIPAMTATNDALFFSSALLPNVFRSSGTSNDFTKFGDIPSDVGSTSPGFGILGSDCTTLYAIRNPGAEIFTVSPLGVVASFGVKAGENAFDIKVDAQNIYVAVPNAGGMYAVDKKTKDVKHFYNGNVFATYVDDDGVYWGEHAVGTAGAIMMRRK